jgi:hypothetical protein
MTKLDIKIRNLSDHPFDEDAFEQLVDAALGAQRPELAIATMQSFYLSRIVEELEASRMSRMG